MTIDPFEHLHAEQQTYSPLKTTLRVYVKKKITQKKVTLKRVQNESR